MTSLACSSTNCHLRSHVPPPPPGLKDTSGNIGSSNNASTCRIRIRHAGGYEQLTIRARVAIPRLQLYDSDHTPLIDDKIDFGTKSVHRRHLKTHYLVNTGKLMAQFYIRRKPIVSSESVALRQLKFPRFFVKKDNKKKR